MQDQDKLINLKKKELNQYKKQLAQLQNRLQQVTNERAKLRKEIETLEVLNNNETKKQKGNENKTN